MVVLEAVAVMAAWRAVGQWRALTVLGAVAARVAATVLLAHWLQWRCSQQCGNPVLAPAVVSAAVRVLRQWLCQGQ